MCVLRYFFFQAEDGIRDLVRSRGLGDVYKRQVDEGLSWVKCGENNPHSIVNFFINDSNHIIVLMLSLIHI